MAISYPVTFPTINNKSIVERLTMRVVQSAVMTESTTSFVQQIQDFQKARWEAEITIRPLNYEEAKVFQAFLGSLRGMTKTFYFGDPQQGFTSNIPTGTHGSAGVGNDSINITNTSDYLIPAGTHLELAGHLYLLLEDAGANDTTNCEIMPPVNQQISAGTLDLQNPRGKFRLATNDIGWDIDKSSMSSFTFACIEAIT